MKNADEHPFGYSIIVTAISYTLIFGPERTFQESTAQNWAMFSFLFIVATVSLYFFGLKPKEGEGFMLVQVGIAATALGVFVGFIISALVY